MASVKTKTRKGASVSASELAHMGVCERLVVFEHRYGKRGTAERRQAIARGLRVHERFYRDGVNHSARRGRCFIAALVSGSRGPETVLLRQFRDQVLRSRRLGRWLIWTYYRMAPAVCDLLEHRPVARWTLRIVLRPIVWCTALLVQVWEPRHGT